jgi:uncharacterized protein
MTKSRYLEQYIKEICFAAHKMTFISGARQCGKTTMAKHLLSERQFGKYYNWDELKFRKLWSKNPSDAVIVSNDKIPIIIFDEIHKARLWKRTLKGIYDTLEYPCDILVTGSARLNTYRKGSDSLQGRYYNFTLHPFSLAELLNGKRIIDPDTLITNLFEKEIPFSTKSAEYLQELMQFGPFPEPLLAASSRTLNLWQRGRIEKIVREDLRDLSRLPELSRIEMLISLLPERASNLLSLTALSEDLEASYTTVQKWIYYLNELYYIFTIKPYSKLLARSIKKMSKIYLWDWSEVEDKGARFENLIALHLLKYCDFLTDTGVGKFELRYLRNKEKQEIDFLILKNNQPWLPIEVKNSHLQLSENWKYFFPKLPCKRGVQVVTTPNTHKVINTEYGEILIVSADIFLMHLV